MRAFHQFRFTPLTLLAASCSFMLFGVGFWQVSASFREKSRASSYVASPGVTSATAESATWQQEMTLLGLATTTEPAVSDGQDPIAMIAPQVLGQLIGEYNGLQQAGTFSSSAVDDFAARLAPNIAATVTYTPVNASSIMIDNDSSYARMLDYRDDMQTALKPLLSNTRAEYEIYGSYIATGDASYLRELQAVAKNYADASHAAARVTVPADILETHLAIVNALARFAATLDAMVVHVDDPFASVALLRTYNDAETAVVLSFDKLAQYERLKKQ